MLSRYEAELNYNCGVYADFLEGLLFIIVCTDFYSADNVTTKAECRGQWCQDPSGPPDNDPQNRGRSLFQEEMTVFSLYNTLRNSQPVQPHTGRCEGWVSECEPVRGGMDKGGEICSAVAVQGKN